MVYVRTITEQDHCSGRVARKTDWVTYELDL